MTKPKQKLELTWVGKGEEPKLEPRILLENPEYSYGDPDSPNMLIHGDNLLALKALEADVKPRKRESNKMLSLIANVQARREIKEMEKKRLVKRHDLFHLRDIIDAGKSSCSMI